jgi:hypothetical protein
MTTPTLMTAAEMRAHLGKKQREEAEHRKVKAAEQLALMLKTLMAGAEEVSHKCDESDAVAIVDLACSLGYEANIDFNDEEDGFYAVVKAPALEVAS